MQFIYLLIALALSSPTNSEYISVNREVYDVKSLDVDSNIYYTILPYKSELDAQMNAVLCIQKLETIASAYAIGRDIHVGDTIIGIKGRVGFEAAAPLLIIKAHHLLEKHTLSKWQQQQKEQLSRFYGMHLHEGQYLAPVLSDIEAFMESSQQMVTGTVFVTLHPYRFTLDGIESPHDLMDSSFGSYGEMNLNWTSDDAKGFINVTANATKIYKHVNKS